MTLVYLADFDQLEPTPMTYRQTSAFSGQRWRFPTSQSAAEHRLEEWRRMVGGSATAPTLVATTRLAVRDRLALGTSVEAVRRDVATLAEECALRLDPDDRPCFLAVVVRTVDDALRQ